MKMQLQPMYDKIVVEIADKQEMVSETGLTYTKNMSVANNTTMTGVVVATGEGRLLADGNIVPMKVKVGDKVVYSKMQGESFNDGRQDYTILSEAHVLMILKED